MYYKHQYSTDRGECFESIQSQTTESNSSIIILHRDIVVRQVRHWEMRRNSRPANLYAPYAVRFVAQKGSVHQGLPSLSQRKRICSIIACSLTFTAQVCNCNEHNGTPLKKKAALTLIFVQVVCPKSARSWLKSKPLMTGYPHLPHTKLLHDAILGGTLVSKWKCVSTLHACLVFALCDGRHSWTRRVSLPA